LYPSGPIGKALRQHLLTDHRHETVCLGRSANINEYGGAREHLANTDAGYWLTLSKKKGNSAMHCYLLKINVRYPGIETGEDFPISSIVSSYLLRMSM